MSGIPGCSSGLGRNDDQGRMRDLTPLTFNSKNSHTRICNMINKKGRKNSPDAVSQKDEAQKHNTDIRRLVEVFGSASWKFLVFTLFFSSISTAAEFSIFQRKPEFGSGITIYVSGQFQPGDFDRFIKTSVMALERIEEQKDQSRGVLVLIDSNGGDIQESMKIGRAIRAMRMDTGIGNESIFAIEGNEAECVSACFFVLVAGLNRSGPYESKESQPGDITSLVRKLLAVHRPYFEASYFASLSADAAAVKYAHLIDESKRYLSEMGVSNALVSKIFSVPSSQVLEVSAEEFKREVGNMPYAEEWIIANCGENLTDKEKMDRVAYLFAKDYGIKPEISDGYSSYLEKKENEYRICYKRTWSTEQNKAMRKYLVNFFK